MTRNREPDAARARLLFYCVLVVSFCALIWLAAKPYIGTRYRYDQGDVSREDIISPRDITYVNLRETQKRIEEVRRRTPAVFDFEARVNEETVRKMNAFFSRLDGLEGDSSFGAKKAALSADGYSGIGDAELRDLLANYRTKRYRERLLEPSDLILNEGYSGLRRGELERFGESGLLIKKFRATEITQEKVEVDEVVALEEAGVIVEDYLRQNYRDLNTGNVRALSALAEAVLEPNLFYDAEESARLQEEEVGKVRPVLNTLKKSAVVIRRGEEITEENLPKLRAISESTSSFNAKAVAGIGILIVLILYLTAYAFKDENSRLDRKGYIEFACFLLFGVAFASLVTLIRGLPPYIVLGVLIPTGGFTMTAELLYRRRTSAALALVLPVFLLLMSGNDPHTFVFSLGSGLVAIFAVRDAEKRSDILKSSPYIAAANLLIIGAIGLLKGPPAKEFAALLLWGVGNAVVSVIFAMGIIPFLEIIMNIPTNFRLLELSDLNAPIMKKIQIEAPGTYYHSVNVANMAESAARAMRANPLLTRVAALYHDVGKIPNAEYYVENNPGRSKHEAIKPSLSNTILKAHVKIGVEMARGIKLPAEVIEIISQHHGTSLIRFFYHQALKKKADGAEIDKKDYHYQGPKPQTREAAIVMLADAVEAASRTLKNPSSKRIEEFVNEIIEGKFREGQLNESPLTLRGLMKISVAFRRYLTGLFHTRIEYPDEREIENARQEKL